MGKPAGASDDNTASKLACIRCARRTRTQWHSINIRTPQGLWGMKLSARASSLYVQTVPKDGRIIGRFSYCFQHGEGIVNPTCCLCHAALNLIPLFITVILLFIIYCSNSRYFCIQFIKISLTFISADVLQVCTNAVH